MQLVEIAVIIYMTLIFGEVVVMDFNYYIFIPKPKSSDRDLDPSRKNYLIEESENALFALGYTQEEIAKQEKEIRLEELKKQLEDLDKKRVRAICEPSMKTETQSWLEYYNEQVAQIRQVMAEL